MITEQQRVHLSKLILKFIDNCLCREELADLEQQLRQSPDALNFYREFMRDYVSLRSRIHTYLAEEEPVPGEELLDKDLWKALSENERTASEMIVEKPQKEKEKVIIEKVRREKIQIQVNKFSLGVAILSAAALFLMILYVQYNPRSLSQEVATLTDSINTQWEESAASMTRGLRLRTNAGLIQLNKGFAEISYDSGAKIILEGPASFEVISPMEITLRHGRLFAKVSKTGKGFTVATRNARVIDLGTEFGVHASLNGGTELHVFKGKTTLVVGNQNDEKQVMDVVAGQAKRVRDEDSYVAEIKLKRDWFVKKIDSHSDVQWRGETVNLAGVVAGEDNFKQGRLEAGIDPDSGAVHSEAQQTWNRTGRNGYNAVSSHPFIDGVFVPDGKRGPNKISSARHTFGGFPETSNQYWLDITANPYVMEIQGKERDSAKKKVPVEKVVPVLGSADKALQSCILIHPNAGITFDLEKIRQANPLFDLSAFKAICGLSQALSGTPKSEFWVLLDGICVFHHKVEKGNSQMQPIEIPIRPDQGFLTLATTDGGDEIAYDWCVFEQPEIELSPKD